MATDYTTKTDDELVAALEGINRLGDAVKAHARLICDVRRVRAARADVKEALQKAGLTADQVTEQLATFDESRKLDAVELPEIPTDVVDALVSEG